jgi:hypothetical protein
VNVAVNGTAATPDGSGAYSVKPGDTVQIIPNQATDWSNTSTDSGAVTLRGTDISATKWSAQIVNTKAMPETLTVSAKATINAALTQDAVFKVAAGDSRNGQYKVFATNGTQDTLALNFDAKSYDMTDPQGVVTSGSIAADASETGTYVFQSPRITSVSNNARFRRTTDGAIVGSFPFLLPLSTTTYAVQPFVAAQNFVTDQAGMDGFFYRLGIDFNGTTRDSQIRSAQIANGGTELRLCNDTAITRVNLCSTPANLIVYAITPDAIPGKWDIVNVANPADRGAFMLASIGGQSVYLSSGSSPLNATSALFRIGVPDTGAPWPVSTSHAGDTNGTWGTVAFDATTYSATTTTVDGTVASVAYNLDPILLPGLFGINATGTDKYFGIQGNKIVAIVGARGPVGGYMQIGTTD